MRKSLREKVMVLLTLLLPSLLFARLVMLPPSVASSSVDTEVATNLVISTDLHEIKIGFRLDNCPSNCIQVAFGCDLDNDRVLSVEETETVFGGRNGRWFAETYLCGERIEEVATGAPSNRVLVIDIAFERNGSAKSFTATNATGAAVFVDLSESRPSWVYRRDWNLMRVTRRGPGNPAEWFACDQKTRSFHIFLR